jgi:hypothetical protein
VAKSRDFAGRGKEDHVIRKATKTPQDRLAARVAEVAARPGNACSDLTATSASPRSEREPAFKSARLRLLTGEVLEVVVRNVSATGARVEFVPDIELSDRVYLSEPTLRLASWAYVVWQDRGVAGLEFAQSQEAT